MLCENGLESKRFGCHQDDVLQNTHALVAMHDVDLFSEKDLADERHRVEERDESNITITDWLVWYVIHFHSIRHVAYSTPYTLELIGNKSYFVTAFYQALAQLVSMCLDASKFWKGKVCADKYAVLLVIMLNFYCLVELAVCFTLGRHHRVILNRSVALVSSYTLVSTVNVFEVVGHLALADECESLLFVLFVLITFPEVRYMSQITHIVFMVEPLHSL